MARRTGHTVSPAGPMEDRALTSDVQEPHSVGKLLSAQHLEREIEAFIAYYNHRCYHESIDNLTPTGIYFRRGQTILFKRARIKRQTIANRRLQAPRAGCLMSNTDGPEPPFVGDAKCLKNSDDGQKVTTPASPCCRGDHAGIHCKKRSVRARHAKREK